MLESGPYPYPLKMRILSDQGHLSNEASGKLLSKILNDHMKQIYLGHLSKDNNIAELAEMTVSLEVTMSDTDYKGNDFPIVAASRNEPSDLIEV
jgi:phosphoribosyl 1,2-cyclic phosphodiesterase